MSYRFDDLAYIAGIVDGEGCICLGKLVEKRVDRKKFLRYRPRVDVNMCDKEAIDFIAERFDCYVGYRERTKSGWKGQWCLSVDHQPRVKRFLEAILPWLKVKRKQAELVLQFIDWRTEANKHRRKGQTNYTEKYHVMYRQMKELNRRGTPGSPAAAMMAGAEEGA